MKNSLLRKLAHRLSVRHAKQSAKLKAAKHILQRLSKSHGRLSDSLHHHGQSYQNDKAEIHSHDQDHVHLVGGGETRHHHQKAMGRQKGHHSASHHGSNATQDGPHTTHH